MVFTFSAYVILVFFVLVFIVFLGYYWTVLRKIKGFPVYHVIPYVMHYNVTGKKPKDGSFNNFVFQMLEDMYKKHFKDGFCASYDLNPTLYLFSEEPIKRLLNEKSATNKTRHYNVLADGIGHGLITSNGERWKNHRKLLSPAFQLGMLKEKVSLFNNHALDLIEDLKTLEGQSSSDHLYIIKRHYFNALSESVFGVNENKENKAEIMKYFQLIDNLAFMTIYRGFQPWLWPRFMLHLLPSGKKYLKVYEDIYSFTKNVILEMKKHIASNMEFDDTEYFSKNFKKSFAYLLLQHHLKDPSFTFDDIHGEVNTFMAAGYDTVSYTTIWCLFMLGLHPQIQQKAFEEVNSASQSYVTYEEMNSFTYLEAIIMETLRLYPTIPIFARSLSEDVQFGKYKVHKGTDIVFSVYFWHRNPNNFPDPERFDPERFLNTEERKPWHHIPFAEGTRGCIGKKYALIEMKIFLAHILRNFKISSLDKKEDVQLCYSVVLTPGKPLRMLITPRSDTLTL